MLFDLFCLIQVSNEHCQISKQEDSDMDDDEMDHSNDYIGDLYNSPDPSSHYEWKNYTVSGET